MRSNLRYHGRDILNVPTLYRARGAESLATGAAVDLPQKHLADRLLAQYFNCVPSVLSVLHWPIFISEYEKCYRSGSLLGVPLNGRLFYLACSPAVLFTRWSRIAMRKATNTFAHLMELSTSDVTTLTWIELGPLCWQASFSTRSTQSRPAGCGLVQPCAWPKRLGCISTPGPGLQSKGRCESAYGGGYMPGIDYSRSRWGSRH